MCWRFSPAEGPPASIFPPRSQSERLARQVDDEARREREAWAQAARTSDEPPDEELPS
jgi:hypothetical protein